MAKKFDIHEWQAKQWLKNQLNEQDDFTPDLEDDELKRSKVQQMMAKEKENAPPVDGGMGGIHEPQLYEILEMYSLSEVLDTAVKFYESEGEEKAASFAKQWAQEFRDFLDGRDGGEGTYIVVGEKEDGESIQYGAEYSSKEEAQKAADERNQNPEYEGISFSVQQELEEQNTTGTGASFNAGNGMGFMEPKSFFKNKFKKNRKKNKL